MPKHDYSQLNTSSISTDILAIKESIENHTLSIQNMPYDWNVGVLNTVIQWIEVLQLLAEKESIASYFGTAELTFQLVTNKVKQKDTKASQSISTQISEMKNIITICKILKSTMCEE